MALALTESLRLQSVDALANPRTRRIVVGFLPRNPATLVSNSWRSVRNQQTTRVKCKRNSTDAAVISLATHCPSLNDVNLGGSWYITDAAVIALATHCPSLKSIDLGYCSNITDAAVVALATHCPNLTKVGLCYCRDVTDEAVATLRESHPGVHIEEK